MTTPNPMNLKRAIDKAQEERKADKKPYTVPAHLNHRPLKNNSELANLKQSLEKKQ